MPNVQPTNYQYPQPQATGVILTRYEYDLLLALFCTLASERLCSATLGVVETLNAIDETDAILSQLQHFYLGTVTVHSN